MSSPLALDGGCSAIVPVNQFNSQYPPIDWMAMGMVLVMSVLSWVLGSYPMPFFEGTLGAVTDIPMVTVWFLLALVVLLTEIPMPYGHRFMKIITLVFCSLVLCIDLAAILWAFSLEPSVSQGFGAYLIYIGLALASLAVLIHKLAPNTWQWSLWGVKVPGIFLIHMSAYSFIHSLSNHQEHGSYIAPSLSLILLFYGIALVFARASRLRFIESFSLLSPKAYGYVGLLCFAWLGLLLTHLSTGNVLPAVWSSIRPMAEVADLVEMSFMSLLLGIGLHVVGMLENNDRLISRLQKTFDNYAMLAATLSHDLKAPIQSEIHAIEMIRDGNFGNQISDEKTQRMLLAVNENNRFELELVQNLVDLLRHEVGEEQFSPQSIEIGGLFWEIQQVFEPLAMRKEQVLRIHCCERRGEEQWITADPVGLKRVLYNLINNAIQHLEHGHRIDVEVYARKKDFLFAIKDNGPGMPPEVLENLFQRFNHHKKNSDTPSTGSGLGLYVSRQIIDRHGGRIWIDNVPGKGCSIYFVLPREQSTLTSKVGYSPIAVRETLSASGYPIKVVI